MKRKIVLMMTVLLFVVGAAGLNHSERSLDDNITVESDLTAEREVRERVDSRCILRFDGAGTDHGWAGNALASLSCPDGSVEHSDDWISARLIEENDSRIPQDIAVVTGVERCPAERVCYQVSGGSIDVTVVNDPPTVRGNSAGNPIFQQNDLGGEMPETHEMSTATVIGFGSFSISKRQARTGRNPQTGKEIQISGDESDQALANRMLASIKASNCPEDGRERCVAEAVKNSEVYSDLSSRGEIEILMTLTADPLVVPRKEVSGDCNDSDTDVRPGELSEKICHFIDSDSDGDGLPDLTMEQVGNRYDWKIGDKTVANATVNSARAADTQVFFLQVESSEAEVASRPELVEAITDHAGLSKADSKKALEGFIEATLAVELDKSSPYIAKSGDSSTEDNNASTRGGIDKASPKLMEELAAKDARITELEERIKELESGNEANSSVEASPENGNDPIVRKKPGRVAGSDSDSDDDGISDSIEEETDEPVRRPGFVDRMLASIFGRR